MTELTLGFSTLRAVLEATGEAIIAADESGTIVMVNREAESCWGYDPGELLGQNVRVLMPDELRDPHEQGMERYKRSGQAHTLGQRKEFVGLRKDGTRFPVEIRFSEARDGDVRFFTAACRDITKRKRAAEKQRKSDEFLRLALSSARVGAWGMLQDGTVWFKGDPTIVLGIAPDQVPKTLDELRALVHPDDLSQVDAAVGGVVEDKGSYRIEHRMLGQGGQVRNVLHTGAWFEGSDVSPPAVIGSVFDITDLRAAEEEVRKLNTELEQRVQDRTAELEAALVQLKEAQQRLLLHEKMASLGNLVAGVAHEINTPVGAVKSAADVASRLIDRLIDRLSTAESLEAMREDKRFQRAVELLRENTGVTLSGANRIAEIVRSLRHFARLDDAELTEADIHEGLESTLVLLRHELKNRIEVRRDYGDVPPILSYPQQLNQVFMNLLVNAAQAIDDKGEIRVRTWKSDTQVFIEVTDSGRGIDPGDLERIFDPGFTTKGVGVGTGLGLSIAYQIVRKHEGELRAESTPGAGATMTVVLPFRVAGGTS